MNYSKYNQYTAVLENVPLGQDVTAKFYKSMASPPSGYIRLETGSQKGVLHSKVEGLKYQDRSGYLYKLVLLGKKEKRVIFVNAGSLAVNRNGHGEILYHFNPDNMDADQNGLHDFSSVVIAGISTKNIDEDMHPVLMCRLPAPDGHDKETEMVDVPAFFRGESTSPKEKETPPAKSRSSQSGKKGSKQKISDPPQTYNHYYNDFIKACCMQICQSSAAFEEVSPFGSGIQGIRWYKVLNIMYLPFINASCQFASADYFRFGKPSSGIVHLSCQDLSARYRHFIFGIRQIQDTDGQKSDAEKYYFGIPGMYCKEEQPDGGKSGFRYWQPLSGGAREKNTYGYWIAAVDAKTGNIEEIPPPENE